MSLTVTLPSQEVILKRISRIAIRGSKVVGFSIADYVAKLGGLTMTPLQFVYVITNHVVDMYCYEAGLSVFEKTVIVPDMSKYFAPIFQEHPGFMKEVLRVFELGPEGIKKLSASELDLEVNSPQAEALDTEMQKRGFYIVELG